MLLRIREETGTAIMIITHDLGVVAGMADRVQVMYGGTVVESADVEEIFESPRMPYTVGLLGSVPNPESIGKRLTPIKGAPPSLLNLPPGCAFGPRCPLAVDDCRAAEPQLVEVSAGHTTRCIRWELLAESANPQQFFARSEIGTVENPASITSADPSAPVTEVEQAAQDVEESQTR